MYYKRYMGNLILNKHVYKFFAFLTIATIPKLVISITSHGTEHCAGTQAVPAPFHKVSSELFTLLAV